VQVGLPKWWEAGSLEYPIDNQTLAIIEIAVFSFLEAKRYDGFKKTGAVGLLQLNINHLCAKCQTWQIAQT